ncbi:MAG: hypothetical protein PF483_01700 [Halothiobacillus sp.]|nr:hypothetical protein [Halothiobacillus sp.]
MCEPDFLAGFEFGCDGGIVVRFEFLNQVVFGRHIVVQETIQFVAIHKTVERHVDIEEPGRFQLASEQTQSSSLLRLPDT